jgi:endo-1,3(4)-beta-glucanase
VVNGAGTYLIYSLGGSLSLTATNTGTITAGSTFTGVLRVVKLNSASHQALLDQYYQTYPTAVATDYSFSGDTGTLSFTWTVQGTASNLLMLTWPHHRYVILPWSPTISHPADSLKLQSPNYPATTALSYLTTKGYMYPILGNVWKMQYSLPTITWNAPRTPDSSCNANLIAGLEYEIAHLPAVAQPGDFYFFGGHVGMVSRLA